MSPQATTDLLTLEAADIGKRTQLPLLDLKRLCKAVLDALHSDLGVAGDAREGPQAGAEGPEASHVSARHGFADLQAQWSTISTLDPTLDASLRGGIPTGYVTEIAGEAGAGKTQLLLSLLLAVQLPPPHGTGRAALYISTEAALSTRRLTQMLAHNPLLASLPPDQRPSLDDIVSTTTPDLESQEHILTYQVPVMVARRDIGLIVLDSVAANFRAEFDRGPGDGGSAGRAQSSNMGARGAELVRLGMQLRDLARVHNLAVVVSNQVADRFDGGARITPLPAGTNQATTTTPAPRGGRSTTATATAASTIPPATRRPVQESPLAARSRNIPNQPPPPLPPAEPTSSIADALPRSSLSYGHDVDEPEPDPDPDPDAAPEPLPSPPPPPPADDPFSPHGSLLLAPSPAALGLDHQQRWFTGWGDDPDPAGRARAGLKTPSLGLVWAAQVACRISLLKAPRYGRSRYAADDGEYGGTSGGGPGSGSGSVVGGVGGGRVPTLRAWRRWAKVVYAPHVAGAGPGLEGTVEFEIGMGGVRGLAREGM